MGANNGYYNSGELAEQTQNVDLSIVVVSYNTATLLQKCLSSVYANPHERYSFEVIVVDNASKDTSCEMVRNNFPQAHLIENSENRGFAAATNQGLLAAKGTYLLLLNPDTEVIGDALWKLVSFLEEEPQAGVVGPALLYADKTFQESAFHFPSLAQIFFDFFPLNWRLTQSRLNGRYPRRWFDAKVSRNAFEIDFPLGACLLTRKSLVEKVGLLDEGFFMYMEEIDWCYRIKHGEVPAGYPLLGLRFRPGRRKPAHWKIYCLPAAKVIHHAGASTRQFREEMQVQLFRSRAYFYRKHYSRRFQFAAGVITRLGLTVRMLGTLFNRLRRRLNAEETQVRLRTYSRIWNLQ